MGEGIVNNEVTVGGGVGVLLASVLLSVCAFLTVVLLELVGAGVFSAGV